MSYVHFEKSCCEKCKKKLEKYHDKIVNYAKNGDIRAQKKLGENYMCGENNYKVNIDNAIVWLKKAAVKGHAESQFKLAICYTALTTE